MANAKPFTFKNIDELPNPPYVRKYAYPLMHTQWIFWHKQLDEAVDKQAALIQAKEWLDETDHTGYLVWHGGEMTPIKRKGLIIDDDHKRWRNNKK